MRTEAVALRVVNYGGDVPRDIINQHFKKLKLSGRVYYSTKIIFEESKLREIKKLILFFEENNCRRYVVADVIKSLKYSLKKEDSSQCIPKDSFLWSVKKYENIAANTWFLIESLRVPSQEEIDSYRVKYMAENQVYVRRLEDVLDASTRPNRVYCSQFHECSEEIEDEFCLV